MKLTQISVSWPLRNEFYRGGNIVHFTAGPVKQIRLIEEELGVKLFSRAKEGDAHGSRTKL